MENHCVLVLYTSYIHYSTIIEGKKLLLHCLISPYDHNFPKFFYRWTKYFNVLCATEFDEHSSKWQRVHTYIAPFRSCLVSTCALNVFLIYPSEQTLIQHFYLFICTLYKVCSASSLCNPTLVAYWGQCRHECLAQGHINTWTRTTNIMVG